MNESFGQARAKLEASKAAVDDAWVALQDSSEDPSETMRTGIESAYRSLDEADSE